MTKFQEARIKYMIKQAELGTYVSMGKGDAVILQMLLDKYTSPTPVTLEEFLQSINSVDKTT